MDGVYDVYFGGEPVGKIYVRRQGLYYSFRCCCCLTGKIMYNVVADWGERQYQLGLLLPENGEHRLKTRVAIKHFPLGQPVFVVKPRHGKTGERFIPLSPQEPFLYLARLKTARLAKRGEQTGVIIDPAPDQWDSDQSP